LSRQALWRAVAVYEIAYRLWPTNRPRHVGVAHIRAAIGLPESLQHEILLKAERERWTKRRVEEEVATRRAPLARSARGRPRAGAHAKLLQSIERFDVEAAPLVSRAPWASVPATAREQTIAATRRIRALCDAIDAACRPSTGPVGTPKELTAARRP
jgi:hypothetical protein